MEKESEMKRMEELQALKARAQALGGRLFTMERRIREVEHKPGPPFFKAIVDPEKCLEWGLCEANCPAEAIMIQRIASIHAERCIGCGHCVEVCPQGAISWTGD